MVCRLRGADRAMATVGSLGHAGNAAAAGLATTARAMIAIGEVLRPPGEPVRAAAQRGRRIVDDALQGVPDGSGFRIAFWRCESPIEQLFCLELFQIPAARAVEGDFAAERLAECHGEINSILVFAQQPILRYRADFLLVGIGERATEPVFIIVECDGEDFHSTREQLRRDERRQQALVGTGFAVARFRGVEIYNEPVAVITKILRLFPGFNLSETWDDWFDYRTIGGACQQFAAQMMRTDYNRYHK